MTLAEGPAQSLRLDQIAEVYRLGDAAQRATVTPREGLDRLIEILRTSARFGRLGGLVGHTILAIGVAMVLMPTLANIAAAAILGFIVGVLKMLVQERTLFAVPMPVVAATVVSAAVFYAANYGLPVDPLHMLVPPLVTFLPGGMLTLGMVELAYGDMVSGSSRLITGFVQLVLLTFGLAAGAALMGAPSGESRLRQFAVREGALGGLGWRAGVLPRCVPALFRAAQFVAVDPAGGVAAIAAQRAAAALFGAEISGFFGMIVAMPASYLIHQRFNGPPAR